MKLNDQLKKHQFSFKKKFGQNFITDPSILAQIADTCSWHESAHVIEIGPGAGTLTQALAERAQKVLALEIDTGLAPILEENLSAYDNVQLLFTDALKADLDALAQEHFHSTQPYKLVANLPYYITTPLIMHALEDCHHIDEMAIMVQAEVADRLLANPGSKAFGAVTVMVQYLCEVHRAFDVNRRAFTPAPDVDSTVLYLRPYQERPHQAKDHAMLRQVIRASFSQRRKTLRNALSAMGCSKELIAQALQLAHIEEARRAETLSIAEFVALSDAFSQLGGTQ